MTAPRTARGFTLVELLVATTISTLTVAAAMTLLIQQQRAYQNGANDRGQQEAGRVALGEVTRRLRSAGYGVDPNLVLDFGAIAVVPRSNLSGAGTNVAFPGYACANAVRCRDSTSAAGSDELVFLSRDPLFGRVATAVTTTSLTLLGELKQPLYAGQLLQVSCLGGSRARAYVTLQSDVLPPAAPAVPNPALPVVLTLQPGASTGGLLRFGLENATLADPCFSLATAGLQPVVTVVDRFRFYVAWYSEAGGVVAAQTAGARPFLMLDRGLGGGAAAPLPIAADVEDLQLTYLFDPAAAGAAQRVVGDEPGVNIADDTTLAITTAVVPPAYDDAPDAASRTTGSPANILGVKVSVVVRAPESDATLVSDQDRTLPAAGNRAAFLGQPNYRRSLFETTVILRNLYSTTFPYPTVRVGGGGGYNVGGG